MNKIKWKVAVFLVVGGFFLQTQVFGAATLTFNVVDQSGAALSGSAIKSGSLLEGYWTDVTSTKPDTTTGIMVIAPNSAAFVIPAAADTPTTQPAKTFAYWLDPTCYFWRNNSETAPGGTAWVRLWSNSSKNYYVYKSFSNGWNTDTIPTMTVGKNDWYGAFKPYDPSIIQFEEITKTPIPGTKTFNLKITAQDGSGATGLRQIQERTWEWGTSPTLAGATITGNIGNALELTEAQAPVGVPLYFRVTHKNWWGTALSPIQSYTVAGGGTVGPTTISWILRKPTTGVNTVSFPFVIGDATKPVVNAGAGLTSDLDENKNGKISVGELIKAINDQAIAANPILPPVVTVFGWYDEVTQKHIGLTSITGNDAKNIPTSGTFTGGTDFNTIVNTSVSKDRSYQVTTNTDGINITIKGYKQ